MASVPPAPPPPPAAAGEAAAANLRAALALLSALGDGGLERLVLCPGSRSGPLAAAAGLLQRRGLLQLHTAIDERSAAFFALGLGRASGRPAAVITTSGTAVANLLPAAVEADFGAIPLLLLTADRPARLKGCGANQTVNQERFLAASVRWLGEGHPEGLALMADEDLRGMARQALAASAGGQGAAPGAVHLNLPFEEPLHAGDAALDALAAAAAASPAAATSRALGSPPPWAQPAQQPGAAWPGGLAGLDPHRPGLVVAGPWRGQPQAWSGFVDALRHWQHRSGWPVLADGLSGLRGCPGLELVAGYDLIAAALPAELLAEQVLRLGPLPASRGLQALLQRCGGRQLLVSEGDPRPLDPLGLAGAQWSSGLERWLAQLPALPAQALASAANRRHAASWLSADGQVQAWLDGRLDGDASAGWSEPLLARRLARLLPPELPLVIANSSPVRDWESFTPPDGPWRPVHGFRGASGIDGTLSLACGVAEAAGRAVLLSGDLALLHDSNGWLWHRQLRGRLTVLLIDNGGGGIFEQLPIRPERPEALDFERLFAMPQAVDPLALAAAHGVPGREVAAPADLAAALAWALEQPLALLRLHTERRRDAACRRELRRMAAALVSPP
ncbi:2-succinyl-5-enolpyruvyl-6-hydroxy-3-cyclohexene-1-carboxylic-acid synthase [Cyanobium sp. CH-040]|uniref:2-succinyl-5-enolpyruvyl-6-hydroxy-3- cyclohexene-1-carboxylic-acid synthase n=1 Tax=Cyanobium sp. CH-040 TaxID=2823708 RepID=UPI0020CD2909|nr:2-succinyl-5-enolpyruvyl-6-hydroxy-3-cyclohexene-1-carboxylic-acid synthase [Cyanobium sp. CH-040]